MQAEIAAPVLIICFSRRSYSIFTFLLVVSLLNICSYETGVFQMVMSLSQPEESNFINKGSSIMTELVFILLYTLIFIGKFLCNESHLCIKANQHQSSLFYNCDFITVRPIILHLSQPTFHCYSSWGYTSTLHTCEVHSNCLSHPIKIFYWDSAFIIDKTKTLVPDGPMEPIPGFTND